MRGVTGPAYLIAREDIEEWVGALIGDYAVIGPVLKERGQTVFEKLTDPSSLNPDYRSTMLGPRNFIYPQRQNLFSFSRDSGRVDVAEPMDPGERILFAAHPCDMHAVSVLDRVFSRDARDYYYNKLRDATACVVLNCLMTCGRGFCSSMGTGPFVKLAEGYDVELTNLGKAYLAEPRSARGKLLIETAPRLRKAAAGDFTSKKKAERKAEATFEKFIDTNELPELLSGTLDHPVYKTTADNRCLNCTNCTMVCPTCYCYDIEDVTAFDLKNVERVRRWDSCQELNFARVHGGNFRASREARLRQFVTHKLSAWVEQYGCFGCIGCGRCMTWCPTGIDLTEMAKQIQNDTKLTNT